MLLEYSYDRANKVLAMFNEGKLATLTVYAVFVNQKRDFVMEYTLISEYPSDQQMNIKKAMSNPNSYPIRMKVTELLNQFIEKQATDSVANFYLNFSAVNSLICKSTSRCHFTDGTTRVTDKQISECLDDLDGILTKMGIGSVKIDNLYRKEGSGKNRKNVSVTLSELSGMIRHILMEG